MKKFLILLAVLAILPAASASADTVYYRGTAFGQNVTITAFTVNETVYAGSFNLSWTANGPTFLAYCVDIKDTLTSPETVTIRDLADLPSPAGNPPGAVTGGGGKAAWLMDTYQYNQSLDNAHSAALQIAIWEVLFDSSVDLGAGNFSLATGTVRTQAQTYLSGLGTAHAVWLDSGYVDTQGVYHQSGQDYGYPIPEPGSMLLLGTGLIGLAGAVRRRLRK